MQVEVWVLHAVVSFNEELKVQQAVLAFGAERVVSFNEELKAQFAAWKGSRIKTRIL